MPNHHPRLKLLSSGPAATVQEIATLTTRFPHMPLDYISWAKQLTEQELLIDGTQYLRIWNPGGCIEMFEAYPFEKYLSSPIPVGDDGGGHALVYFEGASGHGLYKVSFGDIDPGSAVFLSRGLDELLTQGMGLDLIS